MVQSYLNTVELTSVSIASDLMHFGTIAKQMPNDISILPSYQFHT